MSHRAFFDALHAAKVRMTEEAARDHDNDRDDEIGDELADAESFYGDWFNCPEAP